MAASCVVVMCIVAAFDSCALFPGSSAVKCSFAILGLRVGVVHVMHAHQRRKRMLQIMSTYFCYIGLRTYFAACDCRIACRSQKGLCLLL